MRSSPRMILITLVSNSSKRAGIHKLLSNVQKLRPNCSLGHMINRQSITPPQADGALKTLINLSSYLWHTHCLHAFINYDIKRVNPKLIGSRFRVPACPGATGCGYAIVFSVYDFLAFHHRILTCQVWARGSRVTTY